MRRGPRQGTAPCGRAVTRRASWRALAHTKQSKPVPRHTTAPSASAATVSRHLRHGNVASTDSGNWSLGVGAKLPTSWQEASLAHQVRRGTLCAALAPHQQTCSSQGVQAGLRSLRNRPPLAVLGHAQRISETSAQVNFSSGPIWRGHSNSEFLLLVLDLPLCAVKATPAISSAGSADTLHSRHRLATALAHRTALPSAGLGAVVHGASLLLPRLLRRAAAVALLHVGLLLRGDDLVDDAILDRGLGCEVHVPRAVLVDLHGVLFSETRSIAC